MGVLDESSFNFISEELLEKLLKERIAHPEAGAGCIFDSLKSEHIQNELIALKVIMKVLKEYRLQLILFQGLKDTDGLDVCLPIEIDNYEKLILETFS